MGMFSSLVNDIQSTWPGLEAGDRTMKKITSLLSWGLRSSVRRRKSPDIQGHLCVCSGGVLYREGYLNWALKDE